jgi:hypothetical protein
MAIAISAAWQEMAMIAAARGDVRDKGLIFLLSIIKITIFCCQRKLDVLG